jgi:hypothetical protein
LEDLRVTDSPLGADAWITDPQTYLDGRAVTHSVPDAPVSRYLTMRDGVRLALDIHLPDGDRPAQGYPAVLIFTPYYRRFRLADDAPAGIEPSPNSAAYRQMFVPRGYALVVVDVRGTGASFGCRDSFRSPAERADYAEVIDWVAAQTWCDGRLGATGISYLGAACDFAAASGHPALKAIAPISAVWDTYTDHFYPGGILLSDLATGYGRIMDALDQDHREDLRKFYYFAEPGLEGPAPVDDDPEAVLLAEAIADHAANVHMPDFLREFQFRDSALAHDPPCGLGRVPRRSGGAGDLGLARRGLYERRDQPVPQCRDQKAGAAARPLGSRRALQRQPIPALGPAGVPGARRYPALLRSAYSGDRYRALPHPPGRGLEERAGLAASRA